MTSEHNIHTKPQQRPIDPNVAQHQASDPQSSVWVNASAGTGKTKVLTDRVLRLLLPRRNGAQGTPPHKILCLTFTKAAASEMAQRINETLAQWAILPEDQLIAKLQSLLGTTPNAEDLKAARQLFAQTVDCPGGLKIMTLHAFCQSVLARFPLEAGITPSFVALEEQDAEAILSNARNQVLNEAQSIKASPLHTAIHNIAQNINEAQFLNLIQAMTSERYQMESLLKFGADGHYSQACQTLGIQEGQSPEDFLLTACEDAKMQVALLKQAAELLINKATSRYIPRGEAIADFLAAAITDRPARFYNYSRAFLKDNGELYADFINKKLGQENPEVLEALTREAHRLQDIQDHLKTIRSTILTRDLLLVGEEILKRYEHLKAERASLDFDDMIVTTLKLLEGKTTGLSAQSAARWILYKLDHGIDHMLIDEAQDTNPEQWQIIKALCDEFFEAPENPEEERTLFTVGDDKQSIYSFQRASPEEFAKMRSFFEEKAHNAEKKWRNIALNISFRTTQCVLDVVDSTFSPDFMHKGVGNAPTEHIAFRRGQAGLVELWPLCESKVDETETTKDPWAPPIEIKEHANASAKLAEQIANKIQNWITTKEELPSHGRPINAGDIMVLVRSRSAFVIQLTRALKERNIPVSGVDRMRLNEQIAVQDLLAAASFALLPGDDLTLACLLKSPLIGMDEDTLYNIAYPRDHGQSLWHALKQSEHHQNQSITTYLQDIINKATRLNPYDFFSALLQSPCPASPISGQQAMNMRLGIECQDPLDELLTAAINFERNHVPSLQHFLQWQEHGNQDIKREMDQTSGCVRIMTVHASKGLQAPIVILPDTTRTTRNPATQASNRFLWPHKTGQNILLYTPRSEENFKTYTDHYTRLQDRQDEEYRRLLYVAMTRAEDRLYIGGTAGKKKPLDDSWYFHIRTALKNMEHTQTLEDGTLRITSMQSKTPDRHSAQNDRDASQNDHATPPSWLFQHAPAEPTPARPLTPSRPSEPDAPAASPLTQANEYRFRRGNITHKLLEILPDLPTQNREETAKKFVESFAQDLPPTVRDNITQETFAILNHPEYAAIFGENSLAEVPVTGIMADGRVIAGQIDRLLVTDQEIYIIDYKTNRPPPQNPEDIPAIYHKQMQAYAETLSKIYPERTLKCALLWTDGPMLMPLNIRVDLP